MYDGSTALILAARLAVEGMVEELITCHADVNAVDELGKCVCVCVCYANKWVPLGQVQLLLGLSCLLRTQRGNTSVFFYLSLALF